MTYNNAVKYIQNLHNSTGLGEHFKSLCSAFDSPHKRVKSIQICGDAGKTSCAQMLISIMTQSGSKVGSFSPYAHGDLRESIKIGDKEIPHFEFADIAKKVFDCAEKLYGDRSFSAEEVLLMIALIYFAHEECDAVIFEHGFNDNTCYAITPPILSVVTSIFEVASPSYLDDMIPRGTKETVTCIQHKQVYEAVSKTCAEVGCRLSLPLYADLEVKKISLFNTRFTYRSADYSLNAFSPCQLLNAITVIEAAHALVRLGMSISDDDIRKGLSNAHLPLMCRVITIEPTIIVATVENADQLEALIASLAQVNELLHNKINLFVSRETVSLTADLPSRLSSCAIECKNPQVLSGIDSHEFAPQINGIISPIVNSEDTDYAALFIGEKGYTQELEAQINKFLGRFA